MTIVKQKHSLRLDTKGYTEQDILAEIYEDRDLLVALGLESMKDYKYVAVINRRKGTKRIGCCSKIGPNTYEIQLTEKYLRACSSDEVHNTIMHEVIHSAPNCMNHGTAWQNLAYRVNQRYEFTTIKRLSNDSTALQIARSQARYFLWCPKCSNRKWSWIRKPSRWNYYISGKCTCLKCGTPYKFSVDEKPSFYP